MFGQLPEFGAVVPPDVPPEVPPDVPADAWGAGEVDGVAALTAATPPASMPMVSRPAAASLRARVDIGLDGAGAGVRTGGPIVHELRKSLFCIVVLSG
jgi:hypothetical protein